MNNPNTNKPKFHIQTWGCQMNYSDSDKMRAVLNELGFNETEELEDADVIILNTCSVRQRAEDKVSGLGRKFKEIKTDYPEKIIIMTGCMSQRICRKDDSGKQLNKGDYDYKYQKLLRRRLEWIDHFLHIGDLKRLASLIINEFEIEVNENFINNKIKKYMNAVQDYSCELTAYVPISKGCNNFCSYCIVPFTRGEEESRDFESIITEVKELVNDGCKLITLLGQNVNSWQDRVNGESRGFSYLLRRINEIKGDFWITFLSSHPKDFSKLLVDAMADCEKVCKYLNLAVQSGSNEILMKMNRNYTRKHYIEKIEYLRSRIPDIKLSTDIIVGFPGETKADFQDTLDLVREVGFDMAYVSQYSPREGTLSADMTDNVTKKEKKRRKKIVSDMVTEYKKAQNENLIGQKRKILVLNERKGQTFDLRDVILKGEGWDIGKFNKAKIIDASAGGLTASKLN
jgi:tRNA-2-methylthio-N6-dimethylallyladenosine synthase